MAGNDGDPLLWVMGGLLVLALVGGNTAGAEPDRAASRPLAKTLSPEQIVAHARAAGFTGPDLQLACAVALAESGGRPHATYRNTDRHRSTDLGVWQINSYWNATALRLGDWRDPGTNARMARYAHKNSGHGWRDWVTYKKGRHHRHMDRCARAAR